MKEKNEKGIDRRKFLKIMGAGAVASATRPIKSRRHRKRRHVEKFLQIK